MPEFNIRERQVLSSGKAGGAKFNPGIVNDFFNSQRQFADTVRESGKVVGEFAQKMQQAHDSTEVANSNVRMAEGVNAKLNDFRNRNDFENFEKEFKDTVTQLKSETFPKTISGAAKRRLQQDHAQFISRAGLEFSSIRDKTKIAFFQASYHTNVEKAVQEGQLELANQLTSEAFENNLINHDQRRVDLARNKEMVNFHNAFDETELFPEDPDGILNRYPMSRENQGKIRRKAAGILADRKKERANQLYRTFQENADNPDFDRDTMIKYIDDEEDSNTITPEEARSMRTFWNNIDERRNLAFFQKSQKEDAAALKDERDTYDAYIERVKTSGKFDFNEQMEILGRAVAEGVYSKTEAEKVRSELIKIGEINASQDFQAIISNIKRDLRSKKITAPAARIQLSEIVGSYSFADVGTTFKEGLAAFDEIEADENSRINRQLKIRDEVMSNFPPEFWGLTDGKTEKEFNEDFTEKMADIAAIKDPAKQQKAREQAIKDHVERTSFRNEIEKTIETLIRTTPEISDQEIKDEVLRFSSGRLQKDAFNNANRLSLKTFQFIKNRTVFGFFD